MINFCNAKYFGECHRCAARIIPGDMIAIEKRPARGTSGRTIGQDAPHEARRAAIGSKVGPLRVVRITLCRACGKRESARVLEADEARRAAYAHGKRDGGGDV